MEYKVVNPENEQTVLAEGQINYVSSPEMGHFAVWWNDNGHTFMEETELPQNGSQRRLLMMDGDKVVHTHTFDW